MNKRTGALRREGRAEQVGGKGKNKKKKTWISGTLSLDSEREMV